MTRKLDDKFVAWLVGYYDDFIGSFCVVDDKNDPNALSYDHEETHHGNTLNGEAPLNPRYRHSVIERDDITESYPLETWTGDSSYDHAKPNGGIHEYITLDTLRMSNGVEWEGRATNRAPQSFMHQNRAYTGISGTGLSSGDGYMWFTNSRKTNSRYWMLCDHDGSYGRTDLRDYTDVDGSNVHSNALAHISTVTSIYTGLKYSYMTGYFQWEKMEEATANKTKRNSVGQVIKSLTGKPFLVIDTRTGAVLPTNPASDELLMMYQGTLNAIGDNDVFHIRMAHQSFTSAASNTYAPAFQFDIGFKASAVDVTATGMGTTAAITQSITMAQLSDGIHYHARDAALSTGSGTTTTTDLEDIWNDIDIVIDFTAQTFDLYINGTSISSDTALNARPGGGDWEPADLYGWTLTQINQANPLPSVGNNWHCNILLDRVGLIHPITNHIAKTTNSVALESLSVNTKTNGFMTGQMSVVDDDDNLNIYPLISGATVDDWSFMLFRNGDNRCIYTGTITKVRVSQDTIRQTRSIMFDFSDLARSIDRQTPVWEIGQTLNSDDKATGLLGEAEKLYNSLYFGTAQLKVLDDKVGYIASNYEELRDQRTQLYSSHPIQLYNNENTLGPNNPETQWNTVEVTTSVDSTDVTSLSKTQVHYAGHGLSSGDSVVLAGSSNSSLNSSFLVLSSPAPTTDSFFINYNLFQNGGDANITHFLRVRMGSTNYLGLVLDPASYSTPPPEDIYGRKVGLQGLSAITTRYSWDGTEATVLGKHTGTGTIAGKIVITVDVLWSSVSSDATARAPIAHPYAVKPKIWWDKPNMTADSITDTDDFTAVANRANHAVWMRDLPKSLWFQKMFGRIKETPKYTSTLSLNASDKTTTLTSIRTDLIWTQAIEDDLDNGGVAEVVLSNGLVDSFCFSGATKWSNKIQLDGVKFVSMNHADEATINIRDISDDYKHIWVLWADMRNNGKADADGSVRKNKFGLLYPTPDNYAITLNYTDQEDIDGNPASFVNLKVGYDCDMWEIDAESEPYTEGTWSALGSDSLATKYNNWEDKAGSFVILDFSKFFNLNTEANGGKTGQVSGGRISLGDLVIDTEGHPSLIDDYWQEVCATPANAESPFSYHQNWHRFFSAGSNLAPNTGLANVAVGDTDIVLDDTSEFPNTGFGMIEVERQSTGANTTERNLMFYVWSSNNTSTNTLGGVSIYDLDETNLTEDQIREGMFQTLAATTRSGVVAGSPKVIRYNDSVNNITNGYDKIVFYSGLSAPFALRFMMNLEGFVESSNIGTYYASDMIRALSVLSGADTPLNQFSLPISFGLQNVPITKRMTTTQTAVDSNTKSYDLASGTVQDWDNYGGAFDARGKSVMSIITELAQQVRNGENGESTIFTFGTGRDGKLDFRPAYNSGFAFTRDNLILSQIEGSPQSRITNVRVHYNNGASFVDYPTASTGTELRWKYIDLPSVRSNTEALQIAKREYDRAVTPSIKITAEPLTQATEDDKMLWGARYGYVADPAIRTVDNTRMLDAQSWTNWFNGIHYSGMQNGLDGNIAWAGFGTGGAYFNNSDDGGGSSGALVGGADHPAERAYTWIGTKSVSDAVQIVHIPKGCPLDSDASSDDMRIGVILADSYTSSTSVDDVEFYVILVDPNTTFTTASGLTTITDGYGSTSSVKVKHSGFYEIAIPSTYWASQTGDERIVVSVNTEYLRALLRQRNGNYGTGSWQYANAHNVAGFDYTNGGTEVRAYSPFPLGFRNNASIPTGDAPIFHAPRVIITEDVNFVPATIVSYTDASLGLSSATNFTIQDVKYQINNRDHDRVTLTLEQDESRAVGGMAAYIMPEINKGRTPGTEPTYAPTNPGAGSNGNPLGSGGSFPSTKPSSFPNVGAPVQGGIPRNFTGAGVAGGSQTISGQLFTNIPLGVNNTTANLMDSIRGKMDLPSEFGNKDGDFSILGQKKGGAPAQTTKAIEGVDAVWSGGSGASLTSEGAVFPGDSMSTDSSVQHTHEHSIQITVPADAIGKLIVVDARISTGGDTDETAILFGTIECIQTGDSATFTTSLPSELDGENRNLATVDIDGADVEGNTIKVTIRRQPGKDNDDARYGSVVLHSIKTKFVRSALNARSSVSRVLGLKQNGIRFS